MSDSPLLPGIVCGAVDFPQTALPLVNPPNLAFRHDPL